MSVTKSDTTIVLSENKRNFLNNTNAMIPCRLFAKDITNLAKHYQKKHGITIIKNGQHSKEIISGKQREILSSINRYTSELRCAYFIHQCFIPEGYVSHNKFAITSYAYDGVFARNYAAIKKALSPYIDAQGKVLKDLSIEQLRELNKVPNLIGLEAFFDQTITDYVEQLKNDVADVCLTKEEAIKEVEEIRQSLTDDEIVGYVYTSGHNIEQRHFEVLLIEKNQITKPVTWKIEDGIKEQDFKSLGLNLFAPNFAPFYPQQDMTSCGSLGVSCLKKLLKNHGNDLKQFTLSFSFYHNDNKKINFFFPSPSILLYSQSNQYVNFVKNLIQCEEETYELEHNKAIDSITTLKGMLQRSIMIANKQGDTEVIEQNQHILENLSSFATRWLEEMNKIEQKRNQMESGQYNRYLFYTAQRLQSTVSKQAPPPSDSIKNDEDDTTRKCLA